MSTRKCIRAKYSAQEMKLKGKPSAKWNKERGNLRARSHSFKLPTCENELKESLSSEENHQPQKTDANIIKEGPSSNRTWQFPVCFWFLSQGYIKGLQKPQRSQVKSIHREGPRKGK